MEVTNTRRKARGFEKRFGGGWDCPCQTERSPLELVSRKLRTVGLKRRKLLDVRKEKMGPQIGEQFRWGGCLVQVMQI